MSFHSRYRSGKRGDTDSKEQTHACTLDTNGIGKGFRPISVSARRQKSFAVQRTSEHHIPDLFADHDCSVGMRTNNRYPSLFDPDSLMHAAELQLLQAEYQRALHEPPWDGT